MEAVGVFLVAQTGFLLVTAMSVFLALVIGAIRVYAFLSMLVVAVLVSMTSFFLVSQLRLTRGM